MLKDTGRARMNASTKTTSTVTAPVMLCRLCHCEFTNFKEHVKSLVHLDARETKSTPNPPTKHKSSDKDSTQCAKKAKVDIADEQKSANKNIEKSAKKNIEKKDKTCETKESISSDEKANTTVKKEVLDASSSSSEHEDDVDLNGTTILKTDDNPSGNKDEAAEIIKFAAESGRPLNRREKNFLRRHWHCKLCIHVHSIEDESFDKHAHEEGHKTSLARRLLSLKDNYKWRKDNWWILNCSACAFHTNDKSQFLSHLQTEKHDQSVKDIVGNTAIASKNDTPCTTDNKKNYSEKTEQVPDSNPKSSPKVTPPSEQKNTIPKPVAPVAEAKKITPEKSVQGRGHKGSSAPRNTKQQNPPKSNPKPLMSLNLRESLNKNKPGWTPTSATSRNHSPLSKPGILGEYRPELNLSSFGFDALGRDDRLGRTAHHRDSLVHSGIGLSSSSFGRPTYSDTKRDAGTASRTFELDSYRSPIGPDSVWSMQNSLSSPTEKLNSLAFGGVDADSPSRQFDVLAHLLTSQRSGVLPSSVSLDLASNSSFRFKQSTERGGVFDNYPASRPDFSRSEYSRNDYSRNDLPRTDLSRSDNFSRSDRIRSMYTRR